MAGVLQNGSKQRLYLLGGILVLWVLAIAGRLVQLQVLDFGEFTQRAQRQQQRSIEVAPRRGAIYDRNGHELAMSITVDSVFAVPSEIPDQATAATLLAKVLEADPADIEARLKSSRAFAWIARKLDADTADRIRALNLRGIYFQKESRRFYPKRELAAQALGYVGMDDEGLGGLERAYDARLRGKPGSMIITMDAKRRWFGRVERQPESGDNLVLTLDEKIQYIAERELEAAMRQTHAAAGTVVVENPRTGEILALANRPTFNPNTFRTADPQALSDRAVSDIYEPGSTFKVVTLAGALDQGLTRPDEVVDCQMGSIVIAGRKIHDHKPYGELTVAQILAKSSDVGAIKVGLRLGDQRFDQYIRAFGFGSQTGIELPGETRGIARPVSRWSKVSIGAISMGQEIGVSAVQLTAMISAIANDGVWVAPRIVAGTTAPGPLQPVAFHPAQQRRVISTLTAAEMKKMMMGVVMPGGTGPRALLDGYTVAGKTGTAQKADPATHTYSRSKYVASFAGFAPVNDPAVTIVVILDSPLGEHEGGEVAAPVFQRIAKQVLAYLSVPQDVVPNNPEARRALQAAARVRDEDVAEGATDRLEEAADSAEAASQPSDPAPQPTAHAASPRWVPTAAKPGSPPPSRVVQPPAPAPASGAQGGTVIMNVESGVLVPSVVGLPLREAIEAAARAGLEIDASGSGIAREQSPPAGSRIPAGARIAVRFSR
ncbi:MAG TPA: penicillin-binding protein [Terriglobales bacterium]|nr:penicillin-binding protein [Terriglobales bacterium]